MQIKPYSCKYMEMCFHFGLHTYNVKEQHDSKINKLTTQEMCSEHQLLLLYRLISISKSISKAALRLGPRFDVVNSYKSAINI